MRKRVLVALAVFIGLLVVSMPGIKASDLVVVDTPDGKQQVICEIKEETYKYILVEDDGEEQKLFTSPKYAPDESSQQIIVTKVERGQKPTKYARAWNLWKSREYGEAFAQFGEAGSEVKGEYKWLGAYIWYYAGQSAFNEAKYGQVDEDAKEQWYGRAADKFSRLIENMPDHYFAPRAALGLARSQIRLDRFDKAQSSIREILDSDYPEITKKRARVWEGRLLVERGHYDDALETLETLKNEHMEDNPELAYLAMISQAFAWQGKKDYRKAENVFRTVGLQSPDNAMRAEAFNSRGLSLMRRGQLREALFSFLRVVVLHRDIQQEYRKALYYAAVTSSEYYDDAPQRAVELAKKLKNSYPNSYWTNKLKEDHPDLMG